MTAISMPDPDDEAALIAGAEDYLAQCAPTVENYLAQCAPAPDAPESPAPAEGETRRVRRLRGEVAEARQLAALHEDDTPLTVDSPKVRRRRRAAHEAERLHELAQHPAMRAWQASRMRRVLVTTALVALALALGWSTAGVQVFAADGAPAWSPAWVFAWFVEPFMSLALLTVVGAKAYMGARGQPITSEKLLWIEVLFLTLTLGMNAWPHLPGIAAHFSFSRLVLHTLGPIVAVAIVTALPIILDAFARLDHRATAPLTPPAYRPDAPAPATAGTPSTGNHVGALTVRARELIAAGVLDAEPSARALQRALRCGMDTARRIRDELRTT